MTVVLAFTLNERDQTGLHTELIDLSSLARLEIQRASINEFNNTSQRWEVKNLPGRMLFFARSRQACLTWEQSSL